ncbi:Bifunctional inhibitor/lipid-transfer protein/seed storage 2S albumin superfamily protein [Euphorbia peplus]|nr:Bifunctional inhibitor/lipid-transfer protein/seed storage 2S albumin superfamily protein [Euphorbia peplus]
MEMKMRGLIIIKVVMILAFLEVSTCITLCGMNDEGIEACKPSVTTPDPVDPPSRECCHSLRSADFKCLCAYKDSILLPSFGIDIDLALALPPKCRLPPVQC